jgi:hypothetical protein
MASIEQLPPNKPNFLLILVLSLVTMIAIFLFCIFVLHWDGRQLIPGKHRATDHSALRSAPPADYCT